MKQTYCLGQNQGIVHHSLNEVKHTSKWCWEFPWGNKWRKVHKCVSKSETQPKVSRKWCRMKSQTRKWPLFIYLFLLFCCIFLLLCRFCFESKKSYYYKWNLLLLLLSSFQSNASFTHALPSVCAVCIFLTQIDFLYKLDCVYAGLFCFFYGISINSVFLCLATGHCLNSCHTIK